MDPAELRMKNFIPAGPVPLQVAARLGVRQRQLPGARCSKAMDTIGYEALRKEQAEKRARGELMGIGISSFTEIVGAGPSQAVRHPRASRCSTRCRDPRAPHRQGASRGSAPSRRARATRRRTPRSSPRSWAFPPRTSRSRKGTPTPRPTGSAPTPAAPRPTAGAPARWRRARSARRRRRSPRTCWRSPRTTSSGRPGKFSVKGAPAQIKTIQEIAFAAYTNHPQGMEAGLEAVDYYDPPNLTFPFGSYICVVDIDRGHGGGEDAALRGGRRLRQHHQPDDRRRADPRRPGDGARARRCSRRSATTRAATSRRQLHGLPGAHGDGDAELGDGQDGDALPAPSRSAPREWASRRPSGAPPAIANAVVDALSHLGVRHVDIPITPEKVWRLLKDKGLAE